MKENNISNKTEKKVYEYIKEHKLISQKDCIIVGLSGGADSVCLLHMLKRITRMIDFDIIAVHVHHGIRGMEADRDEKFARCICENLGISFISYRRDIPGICALTHESEEECGRRIRYEIFSELSDRIISGAIQETGISNLSELNEVKIAVAHHMMDQVETLLFRMARGTGIKGLRGMLARNGQIIRPLLSLTKEEILEYLREIGQSYCEDATNEDDRYHRNYIRKQVIPALNNINQSSVNHISLLSEEASQVYEYMVGVAGELLNRTKIEDSGKYRRDSFIKEPRIIRQYAIRLLIEQEGLSLKDVSREHIDMILRALESSEYSEITLPGNKKFIFEAGRLYIEAKEDYTKEDCTSGEYINANSINVDCVKIGNTAKGLRRIDENKEIITELEVDRLFSSRIISDFDLSQIPQSVYTKWFDYDKILGALSVRSRQSGDYLIVNSAGGRKSLKDYMINEKIPKSMRDKLVLLADGSKIIWVIGYRISEDVKVSKDTKRVLELNYLGKGLS